MTSPSPPPLLPEPAVIYRSSHFHPNSSRAASGGLAGRPAQRPGTSGDILHWKSTGGQHLAGSKLPVPVLVTIFCQGLDLIQTSGASSSSSLAWLLFSSPPYAHPQPPVEYRHNFPSTQLSLSLGESHRLYHHARPPWSINHASVASPHFFPTLPNSSIALYPSSPSQNQAPVHTSRLDARVCPFSSLLTFVNLFILIRNSLDRLLCLHQLLMYHSAYKRLSFSTSSPLQRALRPQPPSSSFAKPQDKPSRNNHHLDSALTAHDSDDNIPFIFYRYYLGVVLVTIAPSLLSGYSSLDTVSGVLLSDSAVNSARLGLFQPKPATTAA